MQWKMSLSIMNNDAITKHDQIIIVQTVIFTHTVKTSITMNLITINMTKLLIRLVVNGGEIFQITRQTDH